MALLRGSAGILFISRDACAIVSQNYSVIVFMGYRTIIAPYVANWGIAQMCLCQTLSIKGGYRTIFGVSNLPEMVSRDTGYLRILEKAVAVSGVCSGVLEENSGKVPEKLLEKFSRLTKCYEF